MGRSEGDPSTHGDETSGWIGARPVGLIGPATSRPSIAYRLVRAGFTAIRREVFRFHLKVEGAEHLPIGPDGRPLGGYIAVGLPHRTWVEPMLALEAMPTVPRLVFFGDGKAMLRSPVRRFVVRRMGGMIPIWKPGAGADRPRAEVLTTYLEAARRSLAAGAIVLVFAEVGPPVDPGHARPLGRGAILFALRLGVPIVPLIFGGTDELFRGRSMVIRVLPSTTVTELVGQDLDAAPPEPWSAAERAITRSATIALHHHCARAVSEVYRAALPAPGTRRRWPWLTHLWH
jgi:1-acyl-sn-glycerol-3-phosphate acyltransferase